jgi:ribonucleoside-diphosphate reductase subunit M2
MSALQSTPLKQVRYQVQVVHIHASILTRNQATIAIDALKISDSPAKKLSSSADKENVFRPIVGIPDLPEEAPVAKTGVAPTIKDEEAHEPLLQENPNRFVLFPIKYNDVSVTPRF